MKSDNPLKEKNQDQNLIDGETTIEITGSNGNMRLGGNGTAGDIDLLMSNGLSTIHLDGGRGNLTLGGEGSQGDLSLLHTAQHLEKTLIQHQSYQYLVHKYYRHFSSLQYFRGGFCNLLAQMRNYQESFYNHTLPVSDAHQIPPILQPS